MSLRCRIEDYTSHQCTCATCGCRHACHYGEQECCNEGCSCGKFIYVCLYHDRPYDICEQKDAERRRRREAKKAEVES